MLDQFSPANEPRPMGPNDGDLEVPGWEERNEARDRFFENLRSMTAIYRGGEPGGGGQDGPPEGPR